MFPSGSLTVASVPSLLYVELVVKEPAAAPGTFPSGLVTDVTLPNASCP